MQCAQILKSGIRCARRISNCTYCWQHLKLHPDEIKIDINTLGILISEKLRSIKNTSIDNETRDAIYDIFFYIFEIFNSKTDEALLMLINDGYTGSLKKSATKLFTAENSRYLLIEDLLNKLINTINEYLYSNPKKHFHWIDLNFAIFKSPELYNILNFALLPEKYFISSLNLKILPISIVLSTIKADKIKITEDGIYFIRQYIVANFISLSESDKAECGYSSDIIQFFYQWWDLIKTQLLGFKKRLTYKDTAEIIVGYDIFHQCQEERELVYKQLLGSEITDDVVKNILGEYVY
jgi:hypothetical protein